MKTFSALMATLAALLMALGKDSSALLACGWVVLVLIGFGHLLSGRKKPFGENFWVSAAILLIAPSFICAVILKIGVHYVILALLAASLTYIKLNNHRDKTSAIGGGERTAIRDSFFEREDSWL